MKAFLEVDGQPTFCEDGELPTEGANDTCKRGAVYILDHASDPKHYPGGIYASMDKHKREPDTESLKKHFEEFGPHGIEGTENAELHPDLKYVRWTDVFEKGRDAAAFSAFEGKNDKGETLHTVLQRHHVDEIDMGGLLFTHCVKASALDAVALGYKVNIFVDLTASLTPELHDEAMAELMDAGVSISSTV